MSEALGSLSCRVSFNGCRNPLSEESEVWQRYLTGPARRSVGQGTCLPGDDMVKEQVPESCPRTSTHPHTPAHTHTRTRTLTQRADK